MAPDVIERRACELGHIGDSGLASYQLIYRVTYTRHRATETVMLFKPFWGGDMKIVGHHINSEGLLLQ